MSDDFTLKIMHDYTTVVEIRMSFEAKAMPINGDATERFVDHMMTLAGQALERYLDLTNVLRADICKAGET